jgi:hypothetical protein
MNVDYQIEILDTSLNKIAEVKSPLPMRQGMVLTYSKELSDFGTCKFRLSAYDNLLTQYGDIIQPHKFHIRLRRNGQIVWQGAIVENGARNKEYIEVTAAEYEFYLSKILVQRTSNDPATGTADGVFRIFNSGTMADAVSTILTESINTWKTSTNSASILAGMTLGVIENPNYPPNLTDANGSALTGAWSFSSALQLQYDFQTVLYLLKSFGIYTYADFYIDQNLQFNFKEFVGNDRHYDVSFVFQQFNSNVVDYNLPRLGQRMANDVFGIATDTSGEILHKEQSDQNSISNYGLMQGTAAFSDVKDGGILNARMAAELPLVSTPDETNALFILNETAAYPIGLWDVGDIVHCSVQNNGVDFEADRRIVGATVQVHGTGREATTVQTNIPQSWQLGSVTA